MATRDHLMGYAPATSEYFGDQYDESHYFLGGSYPLGRPKRPPKPRRMSMRERLLMTPVLRIDYRSMTRRDVVGSERIKADAIEAARPVGELFGLHLETAADHRQPGGKLVRGVADAEPEISGGYLFDPYKRHDPVMCRDPALQEQLVARDIAAVVHERLNRWDAERQQRIAEHNTKFAAVHALLAQDPFKGRPENDIPF